MNSIDCIDEILINAPIEKVFDTVLDYPNWKQWIPIYKCYLLLFFYYMLFVTGMTPHGQHPLPHP